jgi:hypothetical protein
MILWMYGDLTQFNPSFIIQMHLDRQWYDHIETIKDGQL